MSVGDAIAVAELLIKTVSRAIECWEQRKRNKEILEELHQWLHQLQVNTTELQRKLKQLESSLTSTSWTDIAISLGTLTNDLQDARVEAENIIPHSSNRIMEMLKASDIKEKIKDLRKRVMSSYQTKLLSLTLYTVIGAHDDVMEAVKGMAEDKVTELRQEIERMQAQGSMEESKFFNDVLQQISELERARASSDAESFLDPITREMMCDPVKGSDGMTYDRWTILRFDGREHGEPLRRSPFAGEDPEGQVGAFKIVVDDVDVRRRIASEYPEQEKKRKEMREAYRKDALEEAKRGHLANAEEMLDCVLQWAPRDGECRKAKEAVSELMARRPSNLPEIGSAIDTTSAETDPRATLSDGQELRSGGETLVNGNYELIMQRDDNLVVYYGDGRRRIAIWSSKTWHKDGGGGRCRAKIDQTSGALVICNAAGSSIWSSSSASGQNRSKSAMALNLISSSSRFELFLRPDGCLQLRSSSDLRRIWSSRPPTCLRSGDVLHSGEFLVVSDTKLSMQSDCNLVLYGLQEGARDRPIWASNTCGKAQDGDCALFMGYDGVAAVRDCRRGIDIWKSSPTSLPYDHYTLILMDDGRVVVIDAHGNQKWKN